LPSTGARVEKVKPAFSNSNNRSPAVKFRLSAGTGLQQFIWRFALGKMEGFVKELSQEQIIWYAHLLIKMVLADEVISPSEIRYIRSVLSRVENEEIRKRLVQYLEKNQDPPLTQPVGVKKEILARIYTHLIDVAIADQEIHDRERRLLTSLARLFDFYPGYTKDLLQWAEDGLKIKQIQQSMTKIKIVDEEFLVPIAKLNTEQKKWYIDAIIAALIHEGIKEEKEINLLKMMFESTASREEQIALRNHILLSHRPPIKIPPAMPEHVILLILMEVIQISLSKGEMSYHAQNHLRLLTDVSRISAESYNKLMDWMNRSLSWKKRELDLIRNVRLNVSAEEEEAESKGILSVHPQNNSVQVRKVHCFVCGSAAEINLLLIKHLSQKMRSNIFGTVVYEGANEGFEPVDFNNLRIAVCPACLFASPKKEYFIRNPKDKTPPELAEPRFKERWLGTVMDREDLVEGFKDSYSGIQRTPQAVIASYKLALAALQWVDEHSPSEELKGQIIGLQLNLAEVLMTQKQVEKAEEAMNAAAQVARNLYLKGRNDFIVLRASRVLLLSSLYLGKEKEAAEVMDYFQKYKSDKSEGLKITDRQEFQKLFQEISDIFSKREMYLKTALKGFMLNREVKKAKTEEEEIKEGN